MEIIDNVNVKLHEAMRMDLHKGSKVSIAAAYFSIYAFEKLKKELKNIDKLRFVFTEPTFNAESSKKEKKTANLNQYMTSVRELTQKLQTKEFLKGL